MNVSKFRYALRTMGGILFSLLLLILLVNFKPATEIFFSTLTFITESATGCIVYIVRFLPYEMQVVVFIIIKALLILFGIVLLIAWFVGACLAGLARAGAPVSFNRMLTDLLALLKNKKT
jgi:hypothetical protein